jgi:acetyl esterase/lipase
VRIAAPAAVLVLLTTVVTACAPVSSSEDGDPDRSTGRDVTVISDVDFGGPEEIRLDVCQPADPTDESGGSAGPPDLAPAVIAVHGGGWRGGDKAGPQWRDTCEWLASEGFVVFEVNYRLAPEHPFPAAMDDVSRAVEWIRSDADVERFGHDRERIGAFGDSAGGNLVSLLATRGKGPTSTGTRVSAVVSLSAPLDLTLDGTTLGRLGSDFQRVQLDYLGCASYDDCDAARDASPPYHVDPSDPPFFLVHSTDEFIPIEQAEDFVGRLEAASVAVTYVRVEGTGHALDVLDAALRARIAAWLHDALGA